MSTTTTSAAIEADALRDALKWAAAALQAVAADEDTVRDKATGETLSVGQILDAADAALASQQPAVQQGDAEVLLIAAVDEWFAKNTGLGGCSDGDVRELRAIFAAHPEAPAAQGDALDTERLDWLTFNISGKALRDIGVIWSEHGDARRAIDAARAAKEGGAL